jgi:hypothetical protein
MRKLDLNLDENRGELDFNFDNAIGGSLTTPYTPSSTNIQYRGSLTTPYLPSKYKIGLGSNITTPKINLGISPETQSIMDRIRDMKIPKFDPTSSTAPTTAVVDKGDTKTKKSKMPIAMIGGGVVVVGVIIYFIFKN